MQRTSIATLHKLDAGQLVGGDVIRFLGRDELVETVLILRDAVVRYHLVGWDDPVQVSYHRPVRVVRFADPDGKRQPRCSAEVGQWAADGKIRPAYDDEIWSL